MAFPEELLESLKVERYVATQKFLAILFPMLSALINYSSTIFDIRFDTRGHFADQYAPFVYSCSIIQEIYYRDQLLENNKILKFSSMNRFPRGLNCRVNLVYVLIHVQHLVGSPREFLSCLPKSSSIIALGHLFIKKACEIRHHYWGLGHGAFVYTI